MRLLIALLLLLCPSARVVSAEPLVLQRTIALKGVSGRIDHMAFDPGRKRLFVAELGNGTVDVIELGTGQVVQRIDGLKEPQGVGYAPTLDILAIANGGDGSVHLFQGIGPSGARVVALGEDADNVRFDAASGNFVVGYGNGGLAVIDPMSGALLNRIRLPGHPESFQIGAAEHRAYVNVPDARQIAVVDLRSGQQKTTWRVPGLTANFPLALNEAGDRVASVFRHPPRLVVIDANNGTPVSNLQSCGDADDVFFDNGRHRLYVSCGEGRVDVWQQEGAGYRRVGSIRTASGARTSLFVPGLDRLYVAARAGFFGLGSDAAILEFRPVD